MTHSTPPFEGLRVLDVASWIAAPVAATILGDLGAEVIKVEPPGDGDPYRLLPENPAFPQVEANYTWIMDGRSKRSLTLNLKSDAGREVILRLVKRCDVYITNQPFPVRESLKLTYEDLAPLNPRMIFASLTAYGEQGPERNSGAFDQVAYWARSGLADLAHAPGAPPAQGLPGMGDHPTGVSLFAAIATALYRREQTGRGGMVHTSLHANGFWANGCMGQAALAGADFTERRAAQVNDGPRLATHVLYATQDGRYLQLNMIRTPEQMEATLQVFGLERLLDDDRFATPDDRFENGAALVEQLQKVIATKPLDQWLSALHARGVPATHIRFVEEMRDDQQAKANDVLLHSPNAEVGMPYVINHPIRLDGFESPAPRAPAAAGEHCEEILTELGYSEAEIESFGTDGVI